MRRVIIESPFAGNIDLNLRAAMRDCLMRGEAPFASHGLYTQPGVLNDDIPSERALGIGAGFAWRSVAELTVVYEDLGITKGMEQGIRNSELSVIRVEYRRLGGEWANLT